MLPEKTMSDWEDIIDDLLDTIPIMSDKEDNIENTLDGTIQPFNNRKYSVYDSEGCLEGW